MPKTPEITRLEDLPWDAPPPRDPYERVEAMRLDYVKRHATKKPVENRIIFNKVVSVLEIMDKGAAKVSDWLPAELARFEKLNSVVTRYRLTGKDDFSRRLYRHYRSEDWASPWKKEKNYWGPEVDALLIILNRERLYKKGEALRMKSGLTREFALSVKRRKVLILVAVLDEVDFLKVSPVIGRMDKPEISHELFRQKVTHSFDLVAINAGRRKLRLSEPMR